MADPRIPTARPGDADRVLAIRKEAAEGASISDDRDGVPGLLAWDPEALLPAGAAEVVLGTVIAGFDGRRCRLYRPVVSPCRRRRGIVTAPLEAAERRFAAPGGRRFDAMVLHDDGSGRRARAARGYEFQPQWGRWVKAALPAGGPGGPEAAGSVRPSAGPADGDSIPAGNSI